MVYDGSAEKDIRGIDIDKLAKGFGALLPTFKNFVNQSKTKSREIRWYRKGLTLATAMNPLDTDTTTGVTKSLMTNVSFKARPFVVEQKWERQHSYVKKYFVESPLISMEDRNIEKTAVVKIVIESMSGKANELSPSHTVLLNRFQKSDKIQRPK